MMIIGAKSAPRGCTLCNVPRQALDALDVFEPGRVADAVKKLGLPCCNYAPVDRDEMSMMAGRAFAQNQSRHSQQSPCTTIEILTPIS